MLCNLWVYDVNVPKIVTVNVYFLATLAIQCSMWIIFIFIKVYCLVYSVTNILELCLCVVAWLIVIYYKIKLFTSLKTNDIIVRNVTYMDRALESLQISVPRVNIRIEYILHLLRQGFLLLLFLNDIFTLSYSNTLSGFMKVFLCVYLLNVDFSLLILFLYFYLMVTVLSQRLQLTRCAFEGFDRLDHWNFAWSYRVSVALVGGSRNENILATCKRICSVYRIVYESSITCTLHISPTV